MSRLLTLAREAAAKAALEYSIKGEHADKIARAVAEKIRSVYGDAQYVITNDGETMVSDTVWVINVDQTHALLDEGMITPDEARETVKHLQWFGHDDIAEALTQHIEDL